MSRTPVQDELHHIATIIQNSVTTAGKDGRRRDVNDLCAAYRRWRKQALGLLQNYPENKRLLRWSQVLGSKVLAQLQTLRELLAKQAGDTKTLLDLLVSQVVSSKPIRYPFNRLPTLPDPCLVRTSILPSTLNCGRTSRVPLLLQVGAATV
jgi:hypothetical protein